tara:strand:- start:895 stop:1086 length:192 start_codon:yes stop_codon:yes gene_type:complete
MAGNRRSARRSVSRTAGRSNVRNIHPRRRSSGNLPVGKAGLIWNHEALDLKMVSTPGKWFPHA